MKKNLIFEEASWMLTEEARTDNRLNPIDLDVLIVMQFIKDGKEYDKDGWFNIILKAGKRVTTSVQGTLSDFGLKCDYSTVTRSINKLQRLEYIEYEIGNSTKGIWPKARILKGTVDMPKHQNDEKLTPCDTVDYSVIATKDKYKDKYKEKEKEKDKENKKEIIKEKTKENSTDDILNDYFTERSSCGNWGNFVMVYPSVHSLGIDLSALRVAYAKHYGILI